MNSLKESKPGSKWPLIVLLVFSLAFVSFFYGKIIVDPNSYLFSDSGDGVKNYHTYAWHIVHDSTGLIYEGMNYPYGEHFLYTDCHPVFANSFRLMGNYFPFFQSHSIGILNFLMILAIYLTFFVYYYLLKEMGISEWISLIFAISITLLAPQLFRLEGHLALSYSLAIPLSWLLLERFYRRDRHLKYFLLLWVNNLFWLFIHAYLGVIILFFLFAVVLLKMIFQSDKKAHFKTFSVAGIAILFPLVFYYLFTILTDPYVGRTDNPSGFFLYNAEFDDIFLPHHPPLRPLLDLLTGNAIKLEWEAWSYVGFAGSILFLFLIIGAIVSLFKKRFKHFRIQYFPNKNINIALLASFIVLLFAMGFPFKQFPELLDWFPFIKQFRATGRFAWPFYFAYLVFAASFFQSVSKRSGNPVYSYLLIGVVLIMNIAEAIPYHQQISKSITQSKNLFRKDQLSDSFREAFDKINAEDYQAIITLPFYYHGSESFGRPRDDAALRTSLVFSYHSGIPNVCANLTRTPIPASKNIVQIVTPAFYPKTIKEDIPNEKPFLIIRIHKKLTLYENELLSKASLIGDFNDFSLYSLKYRDLFENTTSTYFDLYHKLQADLFQSDGFLISDSSAFLFYNDFETHKNEISFSGSGSYQGIKKGKNTYAEFGPGTFETGKTYHFSIWMYNGLKDALNLWFRFLIEEWDPKANIWHSTTFFPDQSEVIFGNWSLVEGEFTVQSSGSHVYFVSKGKENSKADLFADDLLITNSGNEVFKLEGDTLFYNNHMIIHAEK